MYDSHGIYYGNNVISKNMIIADRRKLLNGNAFILGVSGGGKSFMAKNEIVSLMLSTDADILVVDPESWVTACRHTTFQAHKNSEGWDVVGALYTAQNV